MKIREQNGKLFCWNCASPLELDMASATPLIAMLPEAERMKMGKALFQAAHAEAERLYPHTVEAAAEDDLESIKSPWYHVLRESVKEGDASAISLIAAYFINLADRDAMLRFIACMETEEPEDETTGEIVEFPQR